ncbi:MAG TPA: isoprenylcysteine carboxylmethyltransferase family protein, partial [Candidatus Berkiella sp.]|nr:isoprenylcysteine carboxylmethyltransferase family protein [Candidatus Berkiella sp.]
CLGWLVKGYFLPLMYADLYSKAHTLSISPFSSFFTNINTFFMTCMVILFAIDVLIAAAGYLFTLRLFDSHIRSTDSTFFGWLVCLVCYEPFYTAVLTLYIPKKINFLTCLNSIHQPLLQSIWCGCVLLLLICYVLATLAFGLRFSNLTNRGIITQGIYRFTKHPAYVAKTSFWWIAFIPLASIAPNPIALVKGILFLMGVTLIYYFRAKTEEMHLSRDPAYVQYGLWMNEHSIFSPLAKHWHFLRYQPPTY